MRVYLNFTPREEPSGGANSFLRTLVQELGRRGVSWTNDPTSRVDVALLNALTDGLRLDHVMRLAGRGVPVVHRKTGFRARGAPGLRAVVEGVVLGDAHQIAFSPYLAHSVFQSEYSRDVFEAAGFSGPAEVIPNGADARVFHPPLDGRRWQPGTPLRLVAATWSTDPSKGFAHFASIDDQLAGRSDVVVTLVGRVPPGTRYRAIRVRPPLVAHDLADVLRGHDALLQLTEHESCSNALIEGLNCGLPVIYLESGANPEMAGPYGVPWRGDLERALSDLRDRYAGFRSRLEGNPYKIEQVADRYLALLERVAEAASTSSTV